MAETDDARAAYLDWLKDEVERWCDEDGRFEVEWDDDDAITPDQILVAHRDYKEKGYTSPVAYLEGEEFMSTYADTEGYFYVDYLLDDLSRASAEVNEGWDAAENVWDDLESVGFRGIDLNLGDLLDQSELHFNVHLATEEEQDHDMGSIVDAFGSCYRSPDLDLIDADTLDNALSYLVNQQGHSVTEVYDSLGTYDGFSVQSESVFIASVCDEVTEDSSEAMDELTALIRMDGRQALDFMDAVEKGVDSLVLPKEDATIGIFNQWAGGGSLLGISLEKDAVLPLSMVRAFSIEGQTEFFDGYTVGSVYGIDDPTLWCEFSYQSGAETSVKEDYGLVLEQARKSYGDHEQQPVQSLSDIAADSRGASQALSGEPGDHDSPSVEER